MIDLLKEKAAFKIENVVTTFESLNAYDIENIDAEVLLFQTGYLTLKEKMENGQVRLTFPNHEVKNSLYQFMLAGFADKNVGSSLPTVMNMRDAFFKNNPEQAAQVIESLFASMPYDLIPAKLEVHFQAVIYIAFSYLGVFIQTEVKYAKGRADAVVHTPERIWILEFKINKSAEEALQQIKDKDYAAAYRTSGKEIVGMGLNFSTDTRQLEDWKSEVIL